MSDLIDRQAAIDAFPIDVLPWDTYCGYAAPHYVKKFWSSCRPRNLNH